MALLNPPKKDVETANEDDNAGKSPSARPKREQTGEDKLLLAKWQEAFRYYQEGKNPLDVKVRENDLWYRGEHWKYIKKSAGKPVDPNSQEPEPVTDFLFNTLANKHGDAMDNMPIPLLTGRNADDEEKAKDFTSILDVVLEVNEFEKAYSDCMWSKIKHGGAVYGIFWDPRKADGKGDIAIVPVDILNVFWMPGLVDIEKSPYFFSQARLSIEQVRQMYPWLPEDFAGNKTDTSVTYEGVMTVDDTKMVVITDVYWKEWDPQGKSVVHIGKYCNDMVLDVSSEEEGQAESGLYNDGEYPFVFDPMFPDVTSPVGLGYIDLVKSPQMYIDKLDSILLKNALLAGKTRVIYRDNGTIDAAHIMDMSRESIPSKGGVKEGEDFSFFNVPALPLSVFQHREAKISELKEISGANDFNRGSAGNGVTAASAIMALQEAGNKLSRAMMKGTFWAYKRIVTKVLSRISQFYDEPRTFRIIGPNGKPSFTEFSQENFGQIDPETGEFALPIYDIKVRAQKSSPYAQAQQNELAKELFKLGLFAPEGAVAALIALEMMEFDGIDKVKESVQKNAQLMQAQMQVQTSNEDLVALIEQMNEVIKQATGQDMLAGVDLASLGGGQPETDPNAPPGGPPPAPGGPAPAPTPSPAGPGGPPAIGKATAKPPQTPKFGR